MYNYIDLGLKASSQEYIESEHDVDGSLTGRYGNEKGAVFGGYLRYTMQFLEPALFFSVFGYFTDAQTDADLITWENAKNQNQTENLIIMTDGAFGYRIPVAENLILSLSTGIGYRYWRRKFNFEEDASYNDITRVFYIPYTMDAQYLGSRIAIGLYGTLRVLFAGENEVNLEYYSAEIDYKNPILLIRSKLGYNIGFTLRYLFKSRES